MTSPNIAPVLLLLGLLVSGNISAAQFKELQWLNSDNVMQYLTSEPVECLDVGKDADLAYQVDVGRQLFRDPVILGGQAASLGLSCNSCHTGGGNNPDFDLDSLSGGPGTADITHAIFSKNGKDNNTFDPVTIPSLVDSGKKSSFGTRVTSESLHDYVAMMLAGNKDVDIPDAAVSALAAYVQALSSTACPEKQQLQVAFSVGHRFYEIQLSTDLLTTAIRRKEDPAILNLLMLSTKNELELLHRRFDIPDTSELADAINQESSALDAIRLRLASLDNDETSRLFQSWKQDLAELRPKLLFAAENSLYLRSNLEQWLQENQ